MKFYKTYPFKGNEEVEDESALFYYRVLKLKTNTFEIVENILKGEIRSITYRKLRSNDHDYIKKYHEEKYSYLDIYQIEEFITTDVYKITDFKSGSAFRFYIFHLNKIGKVVKNQSFDMDYNLLEYQEEIYLEGNHVETRFFYPSSWNISKNILS